MKSSYSNLARIYHVILLVSLIILCFPASLKMAVYTPNILGYIWLCTYILILISFIYLSIIDFKNGNKKSLKNRIIIFGGFIMLTVGLWYLSAYLYS